MQVDSEADLLGYGKLHTLHTTKGGAVHQLELIAAQGTHDCQISSFKRPWKQKHLFIIS
jgi:hypothetical protein